VSAGALVGWPTWTAASEMLCIGILSVMPVRCIRQSPLQLIGFIMYHRPQNSFRPASSWVHTRGHEFLAYTLHTRRSHTPNEAPKESQCMCVKLVSAGAMVGRPTWTEASEMLCSGILSVMAVRCIARQCHSSNLIHRQQSPLGVRPCPL